MLRSFIKIALRCLWRKKSYSILNFACLTFGLSCAIITMLYVMNVLSYDKFHRNLDRLYAVDAYVTYFNGDRFPKEYLSASLTDKLKENVPEAEEMTRVSERNYYFKNGDKTFSESGLYADSNFFDVFTFPLERKGSQNVLTGQNTIVISEKMAIKFFESSDCLGKALVLKDEGREEAYTIAGVFRDVPSQSSMQFDFVIPYTKFLSDNSWALEPGATANATWILLKNNAEKKYVEEKIRNLIKNQEATLNQELFLFPLKEQILYSYAGGKRVWKEMQNIVIIGTIGFAILLIACFNFINLAISLNFRRHKEAGIRKVAGAGRPGIVVQFLGETFIITMLSLVSAVILVRALVAGFNAMFNFDIQMRLLDIRLILFFTGISLFTGLLSGIFPALYLSSASPISTLRARLITGHSYSFFRQSLIVFQFVIPIVLIISMLIINTQDSYMRNFDAGVDKDRVIILDNPAAFQRHKETVRADLLAIPGIDAVTFSNCVPTRGASVSDNVSWEGKDASEKLHFWCVNTDFDYNKVVRIKLIAGRFFDRAFSTDNNAYIINDVAAGVIKNKSPLGSEITVDGQKGIIIGVITGFHAIDLAGPIVPTIMRIRTDDCPSLMIKYSSGSFPPINAGVMKVFGNYEHEAAFRSTLFRDLIPYSNLSLPSRLVGLAFIIALLLACLGLFGLASFTSENRTKEIGIRKSNGATTGSIMVLLLTSYTKWLILAFFIAIPIAMIAGNKFLGRFHFHTPMPLWAFIAGPAIAFAVSLLTVSAQTLRASSCNPVKALRYE